MWKGFVSTTTNTSLKCPITGEVEYSIRYNRIVGKTSDTIFATNSLIRPAVTDPALTGYLWSSGSTTISATYQNSGKYWLRCTDVFGCQQTDTFHFSVLRLSLPIAAKGSMGSKVKLSVLDSSNTNASVSWSNSINGWSQYYTITKTRDTIYATLSDAYRSIQKSIIITDVSAAPEPVQLLPITEIEYSYSIYPNPVIDWLFIDNTESKTIHFTVTQLDGKSMLQGDCIDRIDLQSLNTGIYVLSLNGQKIKFLKN
jgi:hypothetical protein